MCAGSSAGKRAADSPHIPSVNFADPCLSDEVAHVVIANPAAGEDGNSTARLSHERRKYKRAFQSCRRAS
jgi:hypothetical protein